MEVAQRQDVHRLRPSVGGGVRRVAPSDCSAMARAAALSCGERMAIPTTSTRASRRVLLALLWACFSASQVSSSSVSSASKAIPGFVTPLYSARRPFVARGMSRPGMSAGVDVEEGVQPADVAFNDDAAKKGIREATKSTLLGVFGEVVRAPSDPDERPEEESGTRAVETSSSPPLDPVLVCPSTLGDLTDGYRSYGPLGSISYKTTDKRPGFRYLSNGIYTNFVDGNKAPWTLTRREAVMEGTFQQPWVSFVYERGWRQGFNANGFPGIDEEFRMVQDFFEGGEGGTVIDLSCGSGLMTRRLVSSGRYSRVIGADLSDSMLTETARRFRENGIALPELIRCDVSRLPVRTESLDGVHAGAALHCWTKLEESLAEVYRVLKPGRGFFATTFLKNALVNTRNGSTGYKFFTLDELEKYMKGAGFEDVKPDEDVEACLGGIR